MKKLATLPIILLIAILMPSCSKEVSNYARPVIPTSSPLPHVRLITDWISIPVTELATRSEIQLHGSFQFVPTTAYANNIHVHLLYARVPSSRSGEIKRVPFRLLMELANGEKMFVGFRFYTSEVGFNLTINNSDPTGPCPEASLFDDFKYRYIVIPKTEYDSHNINWDNYTEVAQALHI